MSLDQVREKVKLPAVFMMIGAILNTLITAGTSFTYGYIFLFEQEFAINTNPQQFEDLERQGISAEAFLTGYAYFMFGFGIIAILMGLVIFFAGYRMMKVKNWGLAMTGAVLSLIPCQGCCLLGIPIGIFAIMALADSDVKLGFKQNR